MRNVFPVFLLPYTSSQALLTDPSLMLQHSYLSITTIT